MKLVLYKFELDKDEDGYGVFRKGQYDKLLRFVTFAVHFYVEYWMEAPLAAKATSNDLQLFIRLLQYRQVDADVANAAIHGLKLQAWYLTEELAPLCLFDASLTTDERAQVAQKLMRFVPRQTHPARHGTGFGKPIFPDNLSFSTTLADLVGRSSSFFFKALKIDCGFIGEPVADWPFIPGYTNALEKIKSLKVVNDVAERMVKLTTDFLPRARDEENLQDILQIVIKNREDLPNLRAKKADMAKWANGN